MLINHPQGANTPARVNAAESFPPTTRKKASAEPLVSELRPVENRQLSAKSAALSENPRGLLSQSSRFKSIAVNYNNISEKIFQLFFSKNFESSKTLSATAKAPALSSVCRER